MLGAMLQASGLINITSLATKKMTTPKEESLGNFYSAETHPTEEDQKLECRISFLKWDNSTLFHLTGFEWSGK